MSKHTPGPWIACEYGGYGDYDGKCRVVLGEGGDIRTAVVLGFDTPENEANARLIAAAPELLEALRIAREIVVTERDAAHQGVVNPSTGVIDDHDDAYWVAGYDRAMEQIDAAIAKATGEKA